MSTSAAKNQDINEEDKRSPEVCRRYLSRIAFVKKGKDAYYSHNFKAALRFYNMYLGALSEYYRVKVDDITPKMLDKKKDLAEILILSQIYFDLAKLYDISPDAKLQIEFKKNLSKFIMFTSGYRFQVANAFQEYDRKLFHQP